MSEVKIKFPDDEAIRVEVGDKFIELDIYGETYVNGYINYRGEKYEVKGLTEALYKFIDRLLDLRMPQLYGECLENGVVYESERSSDFSIELLDESVYTEIGEVVISIGKEGDITIFETPIGTFIERLPRQEYKRKFRELTSQGIICRADNVRAEVERDRLVIYYDNHPALEIRPTGPLVSCLCIEEPPSDVITPEIFEEWMLNVALEMFKSRKYRIRERKTVKHYEYELITFIYNDDEGIIGISGEYPLQIESDTETSEIEMIVELKEAGTDFIVSITHPDIENFYEKLTKIFKTTKFRGLK